MPPKMYNGFLDGSNEESFSAWGFYSSAGHFQNALEEALNNQSVPFIKKMVSYDIDLTEEFMIDPGEDHLELFHKRKELSYQQEVRYILPKSPQEEKRIINCNPFSSHSAAIAKGQLYMRMNVSFKRI